MSGIPIGMVKREQNRSAAETARSPERDASQSRLEMVCRVSALIEAERAVSRWTVFVGCVTETQAAARRYVFMTIFYTHVIGGTSLARDLQGEEFSDVMEARDAAKRSARRVIAERIFAGHDSIALEFQIENDAGERLASLPFTVKVSGFNS